MQGKRLACSEGADSPLSSSKLTALRHTRLLPRSIPSSFALRSQLIGAEFCASLSAAMLQVAPNAHSGASPRGVQSSTTATEATSLVTALLYDLSAHYGSHTLRRAASYPLGPCYRSRRRRVSRGQHDGRRQLWSLRAAHRMWCRRCGVYLVAGETKALLSQVTPSSFQALEDTDGVTAFDVEGVRKNSRFTRGTYVCRRCLDNEWSVWRKKGCMATPPLQSTPLASLPVSEATNEQSPSTALSHALDTMRGPMVARLAFSVGHTRRRKRKRSKRGSVTRTATSAVENASSSLKAAVRAVPKGSLLRGKRTRTAASKDPSPLGKERPKVDVRSVQRDTSNAVPVQKAAWAEGPPATLAVASCGVQTKVTTAESAMKPQQPKDVRRPATKVRRPASKSGNNSNGTPSSATSFADTLLRLGL
ncbi:hypothetical protein TraAM80_00622 [Trypanosoma rangeli]|uniref:Uncharacterized protein n=1 Tax=Trypanosoma rangeli TaxID=5698 RepID=A0A3R7KR19_TRYRA|nr:uncharacterized protein TraAM80_00622 [Trypanosoma rangeli]RNF11927.1 hypothetical protein TraAM80_00622 [Trypanosoma rangeli]|eukprot:RNF11927.1 hypothetical protein TraAM80_00622 [Trypanosoma rangeli]